MPFQSKKEQVHTLRERGFVVVPRLVSRERCEAMKQVAAAQLRLLFGIAEAFSNYWDSAFGDLYPLLLVLALLAWKPSGLFGERQADVR